MEIKRLAPHEISDFRSLLEIFKEVFENHEAVSGNDQLGKLLSDPGFMVFVIKQENEVLGGLTIYVLQRYFGDKPIAYMYDVGIKPGFQGRGLGGALIAEACRYCRQNGFEEAYVEAESDDMDALRFYRKTEYSREVKALHFTYTFNQQIQYED